jgi:beta-lactamase regulating signal transducer with metallopeptidase domain
VKDLFLQILELSLAASWLVPLVLLLRLVLKKAPRFLVCVLWGMVALRLLMPMSVESPVSMHPGREPFEKLETEFFLQENTPADPIPDLPTVPQETPALPTVPQETPTAPQTAVPQEKSVAPVSILAWVWLAGVCAMALYGGISYLRLRLKVRAKSSLMTSNCSSLVLEKATKCYTKQRTDKI